MDWLEIIIYNIVFWCVYGYVCYLPQLAMQKVIDNS